MNDKITHTLICLVILVSFNFLLFCPEIPEEIEGDSEDGIIDDDDDPVTDLLASASIAGSNDLSKEEYRGTSWEQYHGNTGGNLSPGKRLSIKSYTSPLNGIARGLPTLPTPPLHKKNNCFKQP